MGQWLSSAASSCDRDRSLPVGILAPKHNHFARSTRSFWGDFAMRRSSAFGLFLIFTLTAGLFSGCSRDPNVRKQKYFESGQRYFEKGKYREAAIQYGNAVQVDPPLPRLITSSR